MGFSFAYSPWALLPVLAGAGGLAYWSYRATVPSLPAGWRGLLGGLRFLALALLCILLLEPVLQRVRSTEQPPVLAVVVDESESMQVVTSGSDSLRAAAARDSVRPILRALTERTPGRVRLFGAGASLRSLTDTPLDSLRFNAARTDLARAVQAVPERLRDQNLAGIVLISDGQPNTGRTPLRVADRSPVPVHTVTVGDTARRRDVRLRSVVTTERAYLGASVPVRATVAVQGGRGESLPVTLTNNGTPLDRDTVRLPRGTGEVSTDLSFVPETAGFQRLTVRAAPLQAEATMRNNANSVSLRVLDSKRQVLLLGAAPSPTFGALRRVYAREGDTDVTARVPTRDGSFLGGPLPEDLSDADVVVCAGFPSPAVPQAVVERVAAAVEDGLPAIFVVDRQTDLSAWANHFGAVLPAAPGGTTSGPVEASFQIEENQRRHPVYRGMEMDLQRTERLPPLRARPASWTPAPDARVLATGALTSGAEAPLLLVRNRAGHRTAALLGSGVWRWALLPPSLEPVAPFWPRLASTLLRWVSTTADDAPVRVRPTTASFDGDAPVEFAGQVYDESRRPVPDARVDVTVTDSTGTELPYTMEALGQGRYTLSVGTLPEGTYRYSARAQLEGASLGTDSGTFTVAPLRLESQTPRADPVLMRQLAARSGGTAHTARTAAQLPTQLSQRTSFSAETVRRTSNLKLWHYTWLLGLLLGLLGTEWTLRKYLGLP